MRKFLQFLAAGVFVFLTAAPLATIATAPPVSAATNKCETNILGIPPWYRGLTDPTKDCSIVAPDPANLSGFIWRIVLNVIQIALVIIAYISAFFIIYGGFLFLTSAGNASQVEKGRKSVFNAVIGLAISLSAVAVTNFIFEIVGAAPSTTGEVPQLTGEQILTNALNLTYFILGSLAVVMIIWSGISYITAAGDSGKIARAKNSLVFAIVGLIIVIAAFAITGFVIGRFG